VSGLLWSGCALQVTLQLLDVFMHIHIFTVMCTVYTVITASFCSRFLTYLVSSQVIARESQRHVTLVRGQQPGHGQRHGLMSHD